MEKSLLRKVIASVLEEHEVENKGLEEDLADKIQSESNGEIIEEEIDEEDEG